MTAETLAEPATCALCGEPRKTRSYDPEPRNPDNAPYGGWDVHDVPHGDGTVRRVAVCPRCRIGGRPPEEHDPGTCGGRYKDTDAYKATCRDCREQWSCWLQSCVEGWQDEHHVPPAACECADCLHGHHKTTLHKPEGRRR